jgi:hypothetical protein
MKFGIFHVLTFLHSIKFSTILVHGLYSLSYVPLPKVRGRQTRHTSSTILVALTPLPNTENAT